MYQKGRRIHIKPFSKFQNMLAMVGYCMKDDGKAHYRFSAVNIPEADLENCRFLFASICVRARNRGLAFPYAVRSAVAHQENTVPFSL